jgi:hypothetical protein
MSIGRTEGISAAADRSDVTLGSKLERDRLERRARRVALVIKMLRNRAGEHREGGGVPPPPLRHAIADFEAQAAALNDRLLELR